MTRRPLIVALLIGTLLGLVAAPTGASAASAAPAPVAEWFSTTAIPFIIANAAGEQTAGNTQAVDFSGATHTGQVIEVNLWTAEFIRGGDYSAATVATGDWIASIHAGGQVLGTVTAHYTPESKVVEFVAYDNDVELGRGLDRANAKATVVFDGQTASWMALQASAVVPLTPLGESLVKGSPAIAQFQKNLASRHAEAVEGSEGLDDAVGGGGPSFDADSWNSNLGYIAFGLILLVGLGLLVLFAARRRRGSADAD